jgi:hypothetical protein
MNYTKQDLSRMRYYLPELEALFEKNPKSFPLRNGIAHIRSILGLPQTVTPIDPLKTLAEEQERFEQERRGR